MKKNFSVLVAVVGLATCAAVVQAQEQRRPGGPGREGGGLRMNPIAVALDANTNGVIDAAEIANAPAALKKLDKNGDGKLTEDELRPGPGAGGAPGAAEAAQRVARLMEYDKNGDGKLAREELPERMQSFFERLDADKDGFLTKEEIAKLVPPQRVVEPAGERPPQRNEPAK
jgi:hypothetical protein